MPQLIDIHSRQAPQTEIGHWEVTTIIGKAHKNQIITLTERTSRFTIIQKLLSKTVKTITADRGKEFHLWIRWRRRWKYPSTLQIQVLLVETMKTRTGEFGDPTQKGLISHK